MAWHSGRTFDVGLWPANFPCLALDLQLFFLLLLRITSLGCQHDTARIRCCAPCCAAVLGRRCCWAPAPVIDRCLPQTAVSSKPAGGRCCCRSTGQTDGRSTVSYRPRSAYYAGSENKPRQFMLAMWGYSTDYIPSPLIRFSATYLCRELFRLVSARTLDLQLVRQLVVLITRRSQHYNTRPITRATYSSPL